MRLFLFALVFAIAASFGGCIKSPCSGTCKLACGLIPAASDGGMADVAVAGAKALCETACDTDLVSKQCDDWVANKIDDLGVLKWMEGQFGNAMSRASKTRDRVAVKRKATSPAKPAAPDAAPPRK